MEYKLSITYSQGENDVHGYHKYSLTKGEAVDLYDKLVAELLKECPTVEN